MRFLMFCLVGAVAILPAKAAPWTLDSTGVVWTADLAATQGTCFAAAWQSAQPTHEMCLVQLTNRSIAPTSIPPQVTLPLSGTLTNTSPYEMIAWLNSGQALADLEPGESYTGIIGSVYGRWSGSYFHGGATEWIRFSHSTDSLYTNRYVEVLGIYTPAELDSFTFETPEPSSLILIIAGVLLLRRLPSSHSNC